MQPFGYRASYGQHRRTPVGLFAPKVTIASGLLEDGDVHQSTTRIQMIGLWLASDPVTEEMGND